MRQHGLKTKAIATGGPPGTLTQVMSGQIDIGWAAPPFGLDQLDKKEKSRIIASDNDADVFRARPGCEGQRSSSRRRSRVEKARARSLHGRRRTGETVDLDVCGRQGVEDRPEWLGIFFREGHSSTRDDAFPK